MNWRSWGWPTPTRTSGSRELRCPGLGSLLLGAVATTALIGAALCVLAFHALGAGPAWSQQPVSDLGLLILPAIGLGAAFLLIRVACRRWRRAGLAAGTAVL